jgi:hypothetical protein
VVRYRAVFGGNDGHNNIVEEFISGEAGVMGQWDSLIQPTINMN